MKKRIALFTLFTAFLGAIAALVIFPIEAVAQAVPGAEKAVDSVNGLISGRDKVLMAYAAMGAVAVSCITSAYALAKIGAAAVGAMSEKPEIGGRALVFLGMAEGIAIYGLIVAIMILNKI